ncbi:hypothetical protein A2U01_0090167, partial [Trifolium medium]|nr:hypothetical protein [Trifolium medium]
FGKPSQYRVPTPGFAAFGQPSLHGVAAVQNRR